MRTIIGAAGLRQLCSRVNACAILAGLAAATGALYILTADAIASGHWTMEQQLMPVVVGGTIAAGHFIKSAIRDRHPISAVGFALLFAIGTILTITTSIGRQTVAAGSRDFAAEASNNQRRDEETALRRNRAMLDAANAKVSTECPSGDGPRCAGVKATIRVYQDAIKGNIAVLKEIGPAVPVGVEAAKVGEIVALFGGDGERAKQLVQTLRPFVWSLFLELMAIVALGYGFAGRQSIAISRDASFNRQSIQSDPCPISDPAAGSTLNRLGSVMQCSRISDAQSQILKLLASQPHLAQRDIASHIGMSQSSVSRHIQALTNAGCLMRARTGYLVEDPRLKQRRA